MIKELLLDIIKSAYIDTINPIFKESDYIEGVITGNYNMAVKIATACGVTEDEIDDIKRKHADLVNSQLVNAEA